FGGAWGALQVDIAHGDDVGWEVRPHLFDPRIDFRNVLLAAEVVDLVLECSERVVPVIPDEHLEVGGWRGASQVAGSSRGFGRAELGRGGNPQMSQGEESQA